MAEIPLSHEPSTVDPIAPAPRRRWLRWVGLLLICGLSVAAGIVLDRHHLHPDLVTSSPPQPADEHGHSHDDGHDHADHDHDHSHAEDHSHSSAEEASMVEVSAPSRGSIGLQVSAVGLSAFTKTITVPAIVTERPGQSHVAITAPLTGVVTAIHAIPGEAVEPGQVLFDLRLTHEELVQLQGEFLRTLEELDVVQREIQRVEAIAAEGAIAGKAVLERKYEEQKLAAAIRSQEQALMLHGLSSEQVAGIRQDRKLLGAITLRAPAAPQPSSPQEKPADFWQVEDLAVEPGQHVDAGAALCTLADHSLLYVEGKAYEQDVNALNHAAQQKWEICALVDQGQPQPEEVCSLKLLYVGNRVDPESRLVSFFATLPNQCVRDARVEAGKRFVSWQFRPGQRLQVRVPVEIWQEKLVLPADAVVQEGPESYVFREDGDHFHRCAVEVQYRDQFNVVLGEKNEIGPGDRVAIQGAQQLYLAHKNRAGGGAEAHHHHDH
ncbi:MAG: efflux RND transporter periplasmic adaptor subunit [Pirellulales bacterium]|nr:efflux RND transporter periplasmic adaptor subunit [Pirellulales bacterium]